VSVAINPLSFAIKTADAGFYSVDELKCSPLGLNVAFREMS
jgi:hypothetical protein